MSMDYECQRCGACCRWPGEVCVSDPEIARLAGHLRLTEQEFIEQYTRVHFLRRGLSLLEKPNGECILLDGKDCRVHPVKPDQCRSFPRDWKNFLYQDLCQAIPRQTD
jgi:Fe-S-cluster containining protein